MWCNIPRFDADAHLPQPIVPPIKMANKRRKMYCSYCFWVNLLSSIETRRGVPRKMDIVSTVNYDLFCRDGLGAYYWCNRSFSRTSITPIKESWASSPINRTPHRWCNKVWAITAIIIIVSIWGPFTADYSMHVWGCSHKKRGASVKDWLDVKWVIIVLSSVLINSICSNELCDS